MHPKLHARRLLVGLAALCLMVGGVVQAQPVDRSGTVIVPVGGAVRLQMRSKLAIKQVFNTNPNILMVEADAANPAFVILRGQAQGASKLELTDADNKKESYEVVVQTDIDLLRNILKRAVPTANIEVIPFGNGVVLTGYVARADDVDSVLRIASTVLGGGASNVVSAITVGGVHQVQLDVTVARVDRSKARNRGFNWVVNGTTVSAGSLLGGLASSNGSGGNNTVPSGVGIIPGAATALPTAASNIVVGIIPAQMQLLLQALKTENLAKLLAEPKLVTQSGRPARFLAGGRQATLGASSGITGPGVVYEEIGTELEFLPIVYGNGKIYLEVAPRVRGVNQGLGIVTSFGAVPGFDEQSVRTSIVLESGQTFAIGGLIQSVSSGSTAKVPLLGELPFFGTLFSQQTFLEQEQELVILVTPHLVDAMDCNQVPKRLPGRESRAPDDFEHYLEGILELPRGQRNVFEGKHYLAPWKVDQTASAFPCGVVNYGYGIGGHGHRGGAACNTGACGVNACGPTKGGNVIVDHGPVRPLAELPPAVNVPKEMPPVKVKTGVR